MTIYFISRHPGAITWAERQGIKVDQHVTHLDIDLIQSGDTVIGSLPVNLAAQVCGKGAAYLHLSLTLPEHLRGLELSAAQMTECGARLECYEIQMADDAQNILQ